VSASHFGCVPKFDEALSLLLFFRAQNQFPQIHVDTKSATSMFECLRKKLTHSPAYPHFLSMLQHALLLPRTIFSSAALSFSRWTDMFY
jgi:Diaphanous FH3 Domain